MKQIFEQLRRGKPVQKKKLSLKEIGIEKLIIIFLCGIFLLVLSVPSFMNTEKEDSYIGKETQETNGKGNNNDSDTDVYIHTMEERLKEILKKVDGIGQVEVMITVKTSKEKVPLKDNPYSDEDITESDHSGGTRSSKSYSSDEKTVLIEEEEGDVSPYVLKEVEPKLEGVLVLAEHGDNNGITNEIIEAVQVLFDVPSHKIKVMKMQNSE